MYTITKNGTDILYSANRKSCFNGLELIKRDALLKGVEVTVFGVIGCVFGLCVGKDVYRVVR